MGPRGDARPEEDRASLAGPSIYEQLWMEFDRAYDEFTRMNDDRPGNELELLETRGYLNGLVFAISRMGPNPYGHDIAAIKAEASARWAARHMT